MNFLALLLALGAQHLVPPPRGWADAAYGRAALWLARRLDAGDTMTGAVALAALVGATALPVALLAWLAWAIHPVVLLAVNVAALFVSLRFFQTAAWLSASEAGGHADGPGLALAALREAHHGTFAPLFWFAVLPGPVGLVLHPVLRRAAELWSLGDAAQPRPFGLAARRVFHWVDWLPQRVTALTFAVVGNFEDALYCWRTQAVPGQRARDAVVVAAGAGALGVQLGDVPAAGEPPLLLGTGEPAAEDALGSLAGLLWRALALWVIAFAVLAAIAA